MHLYETHIPVSDPEKSAAFYRDVVGLHVGLRDTKRNIVFMLIGDQRDTMLGLWGPGSAYSQPLAPHHFVLSVPAEELLWRAKDLNARGIVTRDFFNHPTGDPPVMGWNSLSASIYFHDPDGHSVEFIAILQDTPEPRFTGRLSEWLARKR
jgi:lactoylglutathione lyase